MLQNDTNKPSLIHCESFSDQRGELIFNNNFDLKDLRRFIVFYHSNTDVIRAWQGHKFEDKWLLVIHGAFIINCVEIDDWANPSLTLTPQSFVLRKSSKALLHIPKGFANGFKAVEENSTLLLFSNATLNESKSDDFRYDKDLWFDWNNLKI